MDNICGDLDFEEGGKPVVMNRVLGFKDPVLCDSYVCDCIGYDISDVPYIGMVEKLGVGPSDTSQTNIIMLNEPNEGTGKFRMSHRVKTLAGYIEPSDACSACYGALIYALNRLEEGGMTGGHKSKIAIGQGYKGKTGKIGVGSCTGCFAKFLKGCPPKAADMLAFLEDNWN